MTNFQIKPDPTSQIDSLECSSFCTRLQKRKAHFLIMYMCVFKIMITELEESVQPKFSAPLKIQNHLHMTNHVILARKMNLNPNDSVKWSLLKFTNSKRFLNGPAVSSNHTSYLSINLHNPKFYLRNFYRCFTQKVYTQNVQPLPCEWKPCFTCAVLELGQASCPQSTPTTQTHQKHELATQ